MRRILGMDYGEKRIGLALSDPLGITAQPLTTVQRVSYAEDLRRIEAAVREYGVDTVVIGLPLNMDGTEGATADAVRHFAGKLKSSLGLPVEFIDERLTTLQADRMLAEEADVSRGKRKQVRDKLAAGLLLQTYLDRQRQDG